MAINLKWPQKAKVIERNAGQTKCHSRGSHVSNDAQAGVGENTLQCLKLFLSFDHPLKSDITSGKNKLSSKMTLRLQQGQSV